MTTSERARVRDEIAAAKRAAARRPRAAARGDYVDVMVRDFPRDLKRKIVREANRAGANMTDTAVAALAEHFNVTFIPSGRKPITVAGDAAIVTLGMPRVLRRKIKSTALWEDVSARDIVIRVLSRKFLA